MLQVVTRLWHWSGRRIFCQKSARHQWRSMTQPQKCGHRDLNWQMLCVVPVSTERFLHYVSICMSLVTGFWTAWLTWLLPCCSEWSISHRPLVSVSVCLVLPSPSFASCTWSPNLLAFSRNLYQVFVGHCLPLGLAVCTVVPAWLCCCHFTMCVQGEHQSLVSYFLCLQIFVHCLTTCVW